MADLGIASYRFSVAWPRVMPDGRNGQPGGTRLLQAARRRPAGARHPAADDALPLGPAAGLDVGEPAAGSRATCPDRFVDYALVLGKELGDRVPAITTLNEPWCSAYLGYATGEHAPGVTETRSPIAPRTTSTSRTAARSRRCAACCPPGADVSVTLNLHQVEPASDRSRGPGRRRARRPDRQPDLPRPDVRRRLSDDLLATTARPHRLVLRARPGDEARSASPLDSLGVNYYNPSRVGADPAGRRLARHRPCLLRRHPGPADGDGVADRAVRAHRPAAPGAARLRAARSMVTENGMADHDVVVDGRGPRRRPDRLPARPPRRGARRGRPRAPTSAATSCGRCSTTSSGRGATTSASAWCTSTSTTRRGPLKDSARWYADVIAKHGL